MCQQPPRREGVQRVVRQEDSRGQSLAEPRARTHCWLKPGSSHYGRSGTSSKSSAGILTGLPVARSMQAWGGGGAGGRGPSPRAPLLKGGGDLPPAARRGVGGCSCSAQGGGGGV